MKRIKLFAIFLAVLVLSLNTNLVLADPPVGTTPTIDGTIGSDWADSGTMYPDGTFLLDDADDDSLWGADNEIYGVYINWDANNLYFGLDYTISNNGIIAYLDFGDSEGIQDFLAANGYNGAWPRNISFPSTNGIDVFYANWNGANGNVYENNGSDNSTDITGSCSVSSGNQAMR